MSPARRRSCCACSSRASSCASAASKAGQRRRAHHRRHQPRPRRRHRASGSFRADLYYRLNVVAVHLPPLRERREDLPLLIRHFVAARRRKEMGIRREGVSEPEAVDALLRYPWPGNVRELENLIERVLVLSDDEPIAARGPARAGARGRVGLRVDPASRCFAGEKIARRRGRRVRARDHPGGAPARDFNQTRAAELLGTTRRILKYRMDKLGIAPME